jgi:hypothetical protein
MLMHYPDAYGMFAPYLHVHISSVHSHMFSNDHIATFKRTRVISDKGFGALKSAKAK